MNTFEGIYTPLERDAMIKKELKRLGKISKELDESKRAVFEKLINEAAFLAVTLEETHLIIVRDGVIEECQNGANQRGLKKSSAVEVYDKSINTYAKIIDQINRLLPDNKATDPGVKSNLLPTDTRVRGVVKEGEIYDLI